MRLNFGIVGNIRRVLRKIEYQKIMALHVLAKLNSPRLEAYLERAKQSDYKWLRKNTEELSAK